MKDASAIPSGPYCHGKSLGDVCPYWKLLPDRPEQYNGWCDFLGKGDIELGGEKELENVDTGEKAKGSEFGFPVSLLWDQCKECGINEDEDEGAQE